ncbi:MAG: MBL fold metallo-hydrolase [Dehalococcoidales bacterium]|nr:MBL fold metallo-hydrolase [Dehalococcoidales bacterium]
MIDEILPNLYRIEIPLPHNPLRALNSYLIKTPDRCLIIDTGLNREECQTAMMAALESLGVDLNRTDFFITHMHSDHLGMVGTLATATSTVYFNEKEADLVKAEKRLPRYARLDAIFLANGFPAEELKEAVANNPGRRFHLQRLMNFSIKREGDYIDIGDYHFRCIQTPGHSPGHICLYEESKKILVSGDLILFNITPNISFWLEMEDPLTLYLSSLDKVYSLDVDIVLPGHRSIMPDHRKRIRELRAHHEARMDEALSALEDGEKTAYEVAPRISWDIRSDSWAHFPVGQKWFAVGETMAHLHYLEKNGKIKENRHNGHILYSLP